MKRKNEIVQALYSVMAEELSDISQYLLHSEMGDNSGNINLNLAIRKQAAVEMDCKEWIIERSVIFEGKPAGTKLYTIKIGKNAAEIVNMDNRDEFDALHNNTNNAIKLANVAYAQGTIDLLTKIDEMEENQINWAEIQYSRDEQLGLENYLVGQTEKHEIYKDSGK